VSWLFTASASETLDTSSHPWPDNDERTRAAVDGALENLRTYCGLTRVTKDITAGQRPKSG